MAEPRVFISYQRADVPDLAGRVRDRLADVFGDHNVAFTVEIPSSADFRSVARTIESADVVVLLIGSRFDLDRLHSPHDVVRFEIGTAMSTGVPVLPVLLGLAEMPTPTSLPPSLERLAYLQAAPLRSDPQFRLDAEHLIQSIRRLTSGRQHPIDRVVEVGAGEASAAVAAFEAPIGALTNLVQGGAFQVWDEDYVRKAIQMVLIWRDQEGAEPQVFELLVAGVVKRVLDRLTDPAPLRSELLRLGADEYLADDIAGRITATVGSMTDLGDDDPRRDAELLERIAEATDRTAAAVEASELPKSLARKVGEGAAIAAGGAVGKAAGDTGLRLLRESLGDEWSKLQVGLMIAWRAVRDLFVR